MTLCTTVSLTSTTQTTLRNRCGATTVHLPKPKAAVILPCRVASLKRCVRTPSLCQLAHQSTLENYRTLLFHLLTPQATTAAIIKTEMRWPTNLLTRGARVAPADLALSANTDGILAKQRVRADSTARCRSCTTMINICTEKRAKV